MSTGHIMSTGQIMSTGHAMDTGGTAATAPNSPAERPAGRAATARDPWIDIAAEVLVLPLGACEQHGPHLPLDTDTVIAVELAERLAHRLAGRPAPVTTMLAPAISIGASGEHQRFAGTLSIGTTALTEVLIEIVRSADWTRAVVIVNAHGGNADAVRAAATALAGSTPPLITWSPRRSVIPPPPPSLVPAIDIDADLHAGSIETSVMLAIDADAVHLDRIAADREPITATLPQLRRHGVAGISATGVLGDPRHSDGDWGARILDAWTDDLVNAVEIALWPTDTSSR